MKKSVLLSNLLCLLAMTVFSQTAGYWSATETARSSIVQDKAVSRASFPAAFKLFSLNAQQLKQALFTTVNNKSTSVKPTIVFLPNAVGVIEEFEVYEASNFEPALQARFPEIRAFSGKGITDKAATLKLSFSPQGIQSVIFRVGKDNEFIEPYSQDHKVYAVFAAQPEKSNLPWTCSTPAEQLTTKLNQQINNSNVTARSGGNLKTLRLALSVTAEYSRFFGATSASQAGLVLAAVNATLTHANGVYERDLALHLNLIDSSTKVFYYDPATDPYTGSSSFNGQLQRTLTANIGEANYDIGHLFSPVPDGGNAGCIGCICTNGSKGSGWTSTLDGAPTGYTFDCIVMHEMGHQMGANHTFSDRIEGTGANREVASGITLMSYVGVTSPNVATTFIDNYHEYSIAQIEDNLSTKTCPVTTAITNATPVVAPVSDYTIPKSTPFALTGSATDANAGDVLTYCWEQNDNATSVQTGNSSIASPTKVGGPNWLSFPPTTSPTRYFPQLATILAGRQITGPLPGGDAGANIEALSSVARTLNFRLTVRDNAPYRSTTPVSVGQTAFTDMTVTVDAESGPFTVSAPNTAVSWMGGSQKTITWNVANTTASPVNCSNVKISLSTDGGQTFPTVLAASTPNDGTEVLTIPNTPSTTARVKVEAVGNIFFDISNTNFTIINGTEPILEAGNATITAESCAPGNSVIDPGERVTVNFCIRNTGAVAANNLVGTLQNTGGVTAASGPQTYGAVPTGGSSVCRSFTFTASGTCGNTITASINLQDGATNLGTLTYTFTLGVIDSNTTVLTNTNAITIPATVGPATPYASNITVSGTTGQVRKVTVQLTGLSHRYPDDLDILLVSPTGQKVMLMSDVGGGTDVSNANLIFDDAALESMSDASAIPSNGTSTYKPTDIGTTDRLPAPAPARPYAATLSVLNNMDPNGIWSLYVADDETGDDGTITGGWTLSIETITTTCCVTPPPVITAPTVTQPTCTTSTGTIVVNATGSGTLEYSVNNGASWQLSNTFSGLAAGSYNISVRQQTNPVNSTTYSGNPVVINAQPPTPATPVVSVVQPTCTEATGSITVYIPTGAGISYSMDGTNYQTSNVFTSVPSGSYTVTARNNSGCTSDATPVTVNAQPPTPPKPVITANGPTTFCPGGSVNLSAPAGFAAYQWSNGATTSSITVNQSNTYSVVVTNNAGCSSPASDAITVTVTDTEKPVIACPATQFFCYSSTNTYSIPALQATDNCSIASTTYIISGATQRNGNGINASGTFNPGTSTISWTVTDGSNNVSTCTTTVWVNNQIIAGIADSKALNSNGVAANTVYIGYSPASSITLTASASGGTGSFTYQWSNGATTRSITVSPTTATTYTVTVKDGSNCTNTASKTINVVDVRCGNKMDKVSVCHNSNTLCISDNAVADHLAHGDQLGACANAAIASRTTADMNSTEEVAAPLATILYPNPNKGQFSVQLNSSKAGKAEVQITNAQGMMIEQRTIKRSGKTQTFSFNLRNPVAGTYLVKVVSGESTQVLKMIIQP